MNKNSIILLIVFSFCTLSKMKAQEEKKDTISTKEIQEVLIKAQRKKQFSDHADYTFDKEALEKARHSKDLLTTLPELQLDPISNTVTSIKGGRILFLINGIEATDNQIKSIAPTNVVRVEYFDIPPARYSQRADTVVNIITRNPEVGYSYGADVTSALTTGFVNGSAYAGYTKGKNDFGLEYSINFRDYDNRQYSKIYNYDLNSKHYRSEETGKGHFGYTDQNIAMRYANVLADRTFQAKIDVNVLSEFSKGNAQSIFIQGLLMQNDSSIHNSNSSYVVPTLDLYYSKNIGKKDELSINFIGSHYTTKSSQLDHEWNTATNADVFNNDMNLRAKQTGIVGEIAHVHSFEKGKLSSGYRISNTTISNDLVNLLGSSHYDVNYLEQYLYTEYSGKWEKLGYRLGIGVTNIHNKSAETTQDDWVPTPKLVLSYDLAKNQSLRFTSSYKSRSPGAEELSNNVVQVVPNILRTGNPSLKVQHNFGNNLIYSLNSKYVDLNANAFYWLRNRAFNQYYLLNQNSEGYVLTYQNAKNTQQLGIQLSATIKPFGNNLLVLKMVVAPATESLIMNNGAKIKNNYIGNHFNISTEYKSFSAQYQFNIPYYNIDGAFLSTNENASHFFAQYKLNDFAFIAGIYWIGMPSEYKTKSLPESLVNLNAHTQIFNNKNMFVLGLSYDFSSGKKLQIQKKLNNYTAPAATF